MDKIKGAMTNAALYQTNVRAQIAAAYACEEGKQDVAALSFYDAAWKLGLPIDGRYRFFFGYSDILRRAGRFEESETVLRQAIEEFPADKAFPVYLAMTLHMCGRHDESLGETLRLLVRLRDKVVDMAKHRPQIDRFLTDIEQPLAPE